MARSRTHWRVGNPTEYGPDPRITVTGYFAVVLWFLGHPGRAQKVADAAVVGAQDSGDPFTLAAVLYRAASVHVFCRNPVRGRELAEKAVSLSVEHEFAFWHAEASSVIGAALIQQGQVPEGIAVVERALSAMRAAGTNLGPALVATFLAEGYLATGAPAGGLAAVDTELAVARNNALGFPWLPELWRLRGELLLRADGQQARSVTSSPAKRPSEAVPAWKEAEQCFRRALTLARASGAKSLELRAATSLARASLRRGRMTDARRLLGGICGWFGARTGGADLIDARAVLSQIRNPNASARHRTGVRHSEQQ